METKGIIIITGLFVLFVSMLVGGLYLHGTLGTILVVAGIVCLIAWFTAFAILAAPMNSDR